jgi:DNA-binding CsgD family transcriptional regulator
VPQPKRLELSEREKEAFRLLAEGKRDRQIAKALGVPLGTVSVTILRGCERLGAKTRCQAVAMLVEEKLKEPY